MGGLAMQCSGLSPITQRSTKRSYIGVSTVLVLLTCTFGHKQTCTAALVVLGCGGLHDRGY